MMSFQLKLRYLGATYHLRDLSCRAFGRSCPLLVIMDKRGTLAPGVHEDGEPVFYGTD